MEPDTMPTQKPKEWSKKDDVALALYAAWLGDIQQPLEKIADNAETAKKQIDGAYRLAALFMVRQRADPG